MSYTIYNKLLNNFEIILRLLYYTTLKIFKYRLKFYKTGETGSIKFRGTRNLPSLTAFIDEQLGSSSMVYTFIHDLF